MNLSEFQDRRVHLCNAGRSLGLIKPAEAATFLEPTIIRAFRVPGAAEGVGELQGFISHREGLEHVHLIEIVEGIAEQLAVIEHVGSNDSAAKTTYRRNP